MSHSASSKSGPSDIDTPALSPVEKYQNQASVENIDDEDDEDIDTVFDEEDEDYRESENEEVLEKDDFKKHDSDVDSHFESLESPKTSEEEKRHDDKVDNHDEKSHKKVHKTKSKPKSIHELNLKSEHKHHSKIPQSDNVDPKSPVSKE